METLHTGPHLSMTVVLHLYHTPCMMHAVWPWSTCTPIHAQLDIE